MENCHGILKTDKVLNFAISGGIFSQFDRFLLFVFKSYEHQFWKVHFQQIQPNSTNL